MPSDVVDTFGYARHLAQDGGKHISKTWGHILYYDIISKPLIIRLNVA